MTVVFVTTSKALAKWGADVGVSKLLFKLGVADSAERAVQALIDTAHAGETDWQLVAEQTVAAESDAASVTSRLGQKERMLDPAYYPKLKGATGIFKVKLANVENHLLVKKAMAGEEPKLVKLKPVDIARYLIQNAVG